LFLCGFIISKTYRKYDLSSEACDPSLQKSFKARPKRNKLPSKLPSKFLGFLRLLNESYLPLTASWL
jgi:hypothetical protein